VGYLSLASEFPNDNAEISGGTIWICEDLTGPATPELAPPTSLNEAAAPFEPMVNESFVLYFDDDDSAEGPVELDADGPTPSFTVLATEPESSPAEPESSPAEPESSPYEPEPESSRAEPEPSGEPAAKGDVAPAFAHFESALVAALLAQGATRSAAIVPRLLRLESLSAESLNKDILLTLQSRGYLDGHARYSAKYRELCGAWMAVLQGTSQDFAACGTTTLDRFGAELLAALLAVPATRADELRRGLRKAGIAAFGVLEAA
jgi:hypothetical protein